MDTSADVEGLKLEFRHAPTLPWVDMSYEKEEVFYEERSRMRETVDEDTGGAESLVRAGPTSIGADRTIQRLLFRCMSESGCGESFPLNRLLPLEVGGRVRDVCFTCAKVLNPDLTSKKFRLMTAQLRACEEFAVSLTDEMKHLPFENLVFNEFKRLSKNGTDSEKDLLRRIGEKGFVRMCRDAARCGLLPTEEEQKLVVMQSVNDIVGLVESAKKAFGKARLATASAGAEFLRMMFGDERFRFRAGGGYFCENCMTQTKFDWHWTKATGTGTLSGWFCGPCGYPYDTRRMAGVLTYADVGDPDSSFVLRCRMPEGTVANFRTALALANLIRHSEYSVSDQDIERYGTLGEAFRNAIGNDNERYYRAFDKLRNVARPGTLQRPDILDKDLPHFKICDGPGDVTLRERDYGRPCVVYDLKQLFPDDDGAQAELDDGPWKAILGAIVGAWGIADAAACDVATLNKWTNCSKKTLESLRKWTFLRATKRLPPTEAHPEGRKGSESDLAWAAKPFEF